MRPKAMSILPMAKTGEYIQYFLPAAGKSTLILTHYRRKSGKPQRAESLLRRACVCLCQL